MHTIKIRPSSSDMPMLTGAFIARIVLAEGVELVDPSPVYLRRLAEIANHAADLLDEKPVSA